MQIKLRQLVKLFDQQTPGRENDIASLGALMGLSGPEIKDAVAKQKRC